MCGYVILPQGPIGIRKVDETYNLTRHWIQEGKQEVSCVASWRTSRASIIRPHSAHRSFGNLIPGGVIRMALGDHVSTSVSSPTSHWALLYC